MATLGMDPLSAIGLGASVLQFVSFTSKSCELISRIHHGDYNDFDEGIFVKMTRDFDNFSTLFQTRRQSGLDPKVSSNQEVCSSATSRAR